MNFIFISFCIYFLAGILQFFIKQNKKAVLLIFANLIATVLLLKPVLTVFLSGNSIEFLHSFNSLIGSFSFKLDKLSAFFCAIISVVSLLGTIYAKGYLKPYIEAGKSVASHLFLFNIFIISMLSVVLSQNMIFFLISWEIMSLSSFFLLLFEAEKKEVRTVGINYLIKMHVCVLFLLSGFITLNMKTGSFDFSSFNGNVNAFVFVMLFLGFGLKAGMVPLHTWLPKAHPVAPTHISALMSGVMIKTGIYGILRMLSFYVLDLKVSYFVLIIGLLSAFLGILYSIAQRNYKRMLAYSSIENIGIICIGMSVGMLGICYNNGLMAILGFSGCYLHILNHSLFKTLLFMTVGVVYNKVHTKDMEKLGGLIKKLPSVAALFLFGSIAISAIPPLNGFVSEFLIYLGFLNAFKTHSYFLIPVMIISMAILAFVGTMALISFSNAFSIIFLGEARTDSAKISDTKVSKSMLIPMGCLALAILLIGLFPQYAIAFVSPIGDFTEYKQLFVMISKFNFALIIVGGLVLGLRYFLLKNKKVEKKATWGCGYDNLTAKIQYSANSYTRPFLGFLTPFYVRELEFKPMKELFPKHTSFKSNIKDIFQVYCIEPIVRTSDNLLHKLHGIQTGNTQIYLLYGVIFLIICLACLLGGKL